jgi:hypothetical protein
VTVSNMGKRFSAETRAKVAKLLPRLASKHDGEVLSTRSAVQRVLSNDSGADLHDLADLVRGPHSADKCCCGSRSLFEHFRFSSNSGHVAAPDEPTQWAIKRHAPFSFEHLVGEHQQVMWNGKAERFGGLEVDN